MASAFPILRDKNDQGRCRLNLLTNENNKYLLNKEIFKASQIFWKLYQNMVYLYLCF